MKFPARFASEDNDLYFRARVRCSWKVGDDANSACTRHVEDVIETALRKTISRVLTSYSVIDAGAAEAAANAELSLPVQIDECIAVEAEVRLFPRRRDQKIAQERRKKEADLRLRYRNESVRLELLLERLSDARLGAVWWIDKYADLQFSVGNPKDKVESVTDAFELIQGFLNRSSMEAEEDDREYIRRRIEEIVRHFEDPTTQAETIRLLNTLLTAIGEENIEDGTRSAGSLDTRRSRRWT